MSEHAFAHLVRNCLEWDESKWHPKGCASLKKDGVRAFYYPGETILWSRQNKPIYGMGHIIDKLKGFEWPVDMELTVPGMEFNELSGVIRNHDKSPEAEAWVIDIPSPGDLVERLARRPIVLKWLPHYKVYTLARIQSYYDMCIIEDEGIVWKSIDHEYKNKRDWNWMRMVPVPSKDCVCLGVYEGNGKMAGIAGGILVDFNGITCKVGTMKGMTYEDRQELLDNYESYIGVTAEIHYKNLQPSGKPRQPRFKGWRWDK